MDHRSGTLPTNTQHGYDPANYYVWRTPNGFSVHLSLQVVRELTAQIAASGETCGILLGRSVATPFAATIADDFAVIPPSEDFEAARRAAENDGRGLRTIGYFRSQGDGRLRLDGRDLQTFDRWFYENGNIGLMIRAPRRGNTEAALFYWQDGQPQPREFGFGFPFDAAKLAGGHPGWRFPDPLAPPEEMPARENYRRIPEEPVAATSEGIRWSRLWPTAALVVIGITATEVLWNSWGTTSANSAPAVAATQAPTASADETPLGLKVTSQPHHLEIRWNRASRRLAAAVRGTLSFTENGVTEAVPFDPSELREGYVGYAPKTNDVGVQFEVASADGTITTESVRVAAIP
jgi:hypothetical protein